MQPRTLSGLFPASANDPASSANDPASPANDPASSADGAARPRFREPHPIRRGAVVTGVTLTAAWLLLFGLLGQSLPAVTWWLIFASLAAWVVAYGLSRYGDRGVATGVGITAGTGLATASAITIAQWATEGWPLW